MQDRILLEGFAEFGEGGVLDLADSLLAEADGPADLLEGESVVIALGESAEQDAGLQLGQVAAVDAQDVAQPLQASPLRAFVRAAASGGRGRSLVKATGGADAAGNWGRGKVQLAPVRQRAGHGCWLLVGGLTRDA